MSVYLLCFIPFKSYLSSIKPTKMKKLLSFFLSITLLFISCKDGKVKNEFTIETNQTIQPIKNIESWEQPPRWAYADDSADTELLVPSDESVRQVPGSNLVLPYRQVHDPFYTPDWHPQDHPEMPPIVAVGRKPEIFACGFCHRANGTGGPENASINGLSVAYIKQQIVDFKSGARRNPVASRLSFELMITLSHSLSVDEIDAAANYFSSLDPFENIDVVETEQVPLTFEKGWHLAVLDNENFEPIGDRIIEVPADLDQFINRDSRIKFIAYAPIGSIDRGKHIATSASVNIACVSCHGEGLRGIGDIPRLAGRSPSYIVRQLHDFQTGFRSGSNGGVMETISRTLSSEDIIDLAAYIASLKP